MHSSLRRVELRKDELKKSFMDAHRGTRDENPDEQSKPEKEDQGPTHVHSSRFNGYILSCLVTRAAPPFFGFRTILLLALAPTNRLPNSTVGMK
jgi:hypothetical protein